ncbi:MULTISPECIES: hypothetical protein [Leuconostoc]|uniref:Lipoprotein n=1 Tax=Leuconostoc kimchii TaxID=136609 RepID=A0ABX5SLT3_9LACO|nr:MULTISPECIES: hypothetical protein [Leuconostoc]AEJ30440.1 hypothetical protein LGMK_01900 [Leuconostoc sp. C2]QBR47501.1 hypothetical protein EW139_04955 [Leuconostoc kimchii]
MKKKSNYILFIVLVTLLILVIVIVAEYFKSNQIKTINSETSIRISSNHASSSQSKVVAQDKNDNYTHDKRHVFSVPYGNEMVNSSSPSHLFFTTWTLDDFNAWIAYYNGLNEDDKLHATSSFGTPYTFTNLKIDNDQNGLGLTFNFFVQERWFYFNTVADYVEKNGKNFDPKNIQ